MSFPKYPAYKDSGVEWLGEVPEHWKLSKLGIRCGFQSGKAHEPFVADDGQYICVNSRFVSTQGEKVKKCSENLTPASINDILIVMSDLPSGRALGKAFYVNKDDLYAVNQRVCRLTPLEDHPKYLYYVLDRNPGILWFDDGVNQTHVPNSGFTKLFLSVPPLEEQSSIAAFLERETAKIEALIAEQKRLIELLQEKRQAVISHAVTKGLNPDAPMKDSGVEWLGEVPVHWEVMPLKRIVAMQSGNSITAETIESEGAYPVYGGNGLRGYTSSFTHCGKFVLIGRQGALCGNVNYATGKFFASEHAVVATPRKTVDVTWLGEMMRTMDLNQYSISAAQPGLSVELIGNVRTIYAPVEEQIRLASFLSDQNEVLTGLSAEALKAIDLLQERRSALISAAVTGQIDVRGLVPMEIAA